MALYRPSELMSFLNTLGVSPKKTLSQNFLIDGNIVKKILQLAKPEPNCPIIEIGPGPGVLTEQLLEMGCSVIAIEKDNVFAHALLRLQEKGGKLQVIEADVLQVNFDALIEKKAIVIANIPYHITSEIIEKILFCEKLAHATLLVQEDVAERVIAKPCDDQYDRLSLLTSYFSEPHFGFHVKKSCFYPAPKVGSAVVHFDIKKRHPARNEALLLRLMTTCFSQRRKMMKGVLREEYGDDKLAYAFEGMNPNSRPDQLSYVEWVEFADKLASV